VQARPGNTPVEPGVASPPLTVIPPVIAVILLLVVIGLLGARALSKGR
jgi:hypothetical protein